MRQRQSLGDTPILAATGYATATAPGESHSSGLQRFDFKDYAGRFLLDSQTNDLPFLAKAEVRRRIGTFTTVDATDSPRLALEPVGHASSWPPFCTWPQEGCVLPANGGDLITIDVSFVFETHAAWQFDDGSLYVLGSTLWSVRFAGDLERDQSCALTPPTPRPLPCRPYKFTPSPFNGNYRSRRDPSTGRGLFFWSSESPPATLAPPIANEGGEAWRR